ncbi:replication-associated recombination protein A [Phycisphaera mikurensis]|uniref:Replication-associated recombination protein A n=1 Tax=Phycisphaera mikurensis (strain NBRC 102666 / KCTC 22515 / FYK2301M01) TaxID=1142394 RepID=I0IFH4_PHYMF|nr:replication-associated recombination protein A [Phycisphaera mikurensis]MBB6440596.1 putative ATPase [Phycisphaera mikurensis]BAM04012.1 replication-associated recombination protein A [Phycisphaera mikurensis NBRC 102666]
MQDLFADRRQQKRDAAAPLAVRMRPRTLDAYAGQKHLLGPGEPLARLIAADRLGSVLLYGPPGTGKTTLAELIARRTDAVFVRGHAASAGVKEVRQVLDAARQRLELDGHRTVYFLDEVHRFSKSQQDVLLEDVERGVVTLIGATTENPMYAVNAALVSRSQIFALEPLSERDVAGVLRRAVADEDNGYGGQGVTLDQDALAFLARASDGDARRALNALEVAVLSERHAAEEGSADRGPGDAETAPVRGFPPVRVTLGAAEKSLQRKALAYDRAGTEHHDTISAFIKSVRGSDPDAALYWLAKMIVAGEDPRFLARRIAILASEDVGNADPRGILVAAACFDVVERIGMPEARITLAQATVYLATAPKSNASYAAINAAIADVEANRTQPVPTALRSARNRKSGDYKYAHAAEGGVSDETYLGVPTTFYTPTDRGHEVRIAAYLQWVKERRGA